MRIAAFAIVIALSSALLLQHREALEMPGYHTSKSFGLGNQSRRDFEVMVARDLGPWYASVQSRRDLPGVGGQGPRSLARGVGLDWPGFRGGPTMSGVTRPALTPPLKQVWMRDVRGPVESTAAIVGDTAYVATMKGRLMALRLLDGQPRWTFTSRDSFSASPCVSGGSVFIGDEGGIFYCLDASTGKPRWKVETGDKIVSSAAPAPGLILFGSYDCNLYALDPRTGHKRWTFRSDAQVHCSPCVAGSSVVIAGCDGKVRILNLATGKQRKAIVVGGNLAAAPAYAGGAVYLGALRGVYLGIRVSDGRTLWKMEEREPGAACYASAAVPPGGVVFASRSARVFCVEPTRGQHRWTFRTRGEVDSSPVVAGPTVYVGSGEGVLYGIDMATGLKQWEFRAGQEIKASPAIGQGRLVIGTEDGAVHCFASAR